MGNVYYEDNKSIKYVNENGTSEEVLKLSNIKKIDDCIYYPPCQPERSKREDLNNGFFPPPWNAYDHPEKTEGWLEFQREMKKDPKYYLGCGALNSMET